MLYACNACRRFVREDEPCPFCGDATPRPRERFKQFGRIFIAASAAGTVSMIACSAYGMPVPVQDGGGPPWAEAGPRPDAADADVSDGD